VNLMYGELPLGFVGGGGEYQIEFAYFAGVHARHFTNSGILRDLFESRDLSTPAFGIEVTADQNGRVNFGVTVRFMADFKGKFELNAFDTAKLSRIAFADGTTLEERGYTLVFDSGMVSPNLAVNEAVPEPTTLAAWSMLGLLGLIVRKCYARKSI
jgi:hypothetical protein